MALLNAYRNRVPRGARKASRIHNLYNYNDSLDSSNIEKLFPMKSINFSENGKHQLVTRRYVFILIIEQFYITVSTSVKL